MILVHHLVDVRTGSVEETIEVHVKVPVITPVLHLPHTDGVVVSHDAHGFNGSDTSI